MILSGAIERLRDVVRRQHKAIATEDSYVYWLRHSSPSLHRSFPQPPSSVSGPLSPAFFGITDRVPLKQKLRTCTPGQPNAQYQRAATFSHQPSLSL
jgi:hypothetical protein